MSFSSHFLMSYDMTCDCLNYRLLGHVSLLFVETAMHYHKVSEKNRHRIIFISVLEYSDSNSPKTSSSVFSLILCIAWFSILLEMLIPKISTRILAISNERMLLLEESLPPIYFHIRCKHYYSALLMLSFSV